MGWTNTKRKYGPCEVCKKPVQRLEPHRVSGQRIWHKECFESLYIDCGDD